MNIIKTFYEEAILECNVHKTRNESFIIKRGIRVSKAKDEDYYRVEDTRGSDFYSGLKEADYKELVDRGFIEGCDYIGFYRDTKRLCKLKRVIERLYSKKKMFQRLIKEDQRLNEKRIRNIYKNIEIFVDEIFLCKSRITQFNNKYNN